MCRTGCPGLCVLEFKYSVAPTRRIVVVTTVRLVREAEIQLRRLRLHLIPLELRTHGPRPITLVSLQGRLPDLHRLHSPAIHNDSWTL